MTMRSDAEFEEKLTLGSKNGMMNLVNYFTGLLPTALKFP